MCSCIGNKNWKTKYILMFSIFITVLSGTYINCIVNYTIINWFNFCSDYLCKFTHIDDIYVCNSTNILHATSEILIKNYYEYNGILSLNDVQIQTFSNKITNITMIINICFNSIVLFIVLIIWYIFVCLIYTYRKYY